MKIKFKMSEDGNTTQIASFTVPGATDIEVAIEAAKEWCENEGWYFIGVVN